jgi:hypothetical protein
MSVANIIILLSSFFEASKEEPLAINIKKAEKNRKQQAANRIKKTLRTR